MIRLNVALSCRQEWPWSRPACFNHAGQRVAAECSSEIRHPEEILINRLNTVMLALLAIVTLSVASLALAQEATASDVDASITNANVSLARGDYELAQYFFREALRLDPGNAEALYGNGRALAGRFNYPLAIESFHSAIEADPSNVMAYVHLALAYQSQFLADPERYPSSLNDAISVLATAESLSPDNTQVLNTKGVILFQMGEFEAARAALEHAASVAPADDAISSRMESVIQVNLGKTYRDLGNADQALSAFRRAVVLDPGSSSAHASLGNALFQAGECEAAEFELQQAVSIDPSSLSAVSDLAIALFECGKVAESVPRFEQAIELDGSLFLPPLYTYLARGLIETGRYEEAVYRASHAVVLPPYTADAHYYLANAYCARGAAGDTALAAEEFRKALAIDPAHEGALAGTTGGCSVF